MGQFQQTRARIGSRVMYGACTVCALVIIAILLLIIGYLLIVGVRCLSWSFLTNLPDDSPPGMRNNIEGTIILVLLASAVGIPLGLLAGIYLSEYDVGSLLAAPVRFVADVLAGVPSIVVGILGYELLVVPMGTYSGWAGAAALGFIMIPIVARTTEEMLRLVPGSYRQASIALGATKGRTILRVVAPSATGSLLTGAMLAVARVAGETAPLLFTAVGSRAIVHDPNSPFPSLTLGIYEMSNQPSPEARAQAWAGILVLIALIFLVNLAGRYFTRPRRR